MIANWSLSLSLLLLKNPGTAIKRFRETLEYSALRSPTPNMITPMDFFLPYLRCEYPSRCSSVLRIKKQKNEICKMMLYFFIFFLSWNGRNWNLEKPWNVVPWGVSLPNPYVITPIHCFLLFSALRNLFPLVLLFPESL